MSHPFSVLFTAFEPSGDTVASAMIAGLTRLRPDLNIWALGGPKMQAQGAKLLETTTEQAAMHLNAAAHALKHRRWRQRLRIWLSEHRIDALVPVDSPAANWAICRLARQCRWSPRIVHLVAPQLWAWAPWRIRKLRRLTDHVLCLLPFEPAWFSQRGVASTFVGHPLFDRIVTHRDNDDIAQYREFPENASPKIALLPGSRRGELHANWPTMWEVFKRLHHRFPGLGAVVAAIDQDAHHWLTQQIDQDVATGLDTGIATRIRVVPHAVDAAVRWADAVLVVSGTATLHVAAHRQPMVVLYNMNRWMWQLLGRWVVQTRTFSLPNLIAEADHRGRIVPEFVPHHGEPGPITHAMHQLLADPAARQRQIDSLTDITSFYTGVNFEQTASSKLLKLIEDIR